MRKKDQDILVRGDTSRSGGKPDAQKRDSFQVRYEKTKSFERMVTKIINSWTYFLIRIKWYNKKSETLLAFPTDIWFSCRHHFVVFFLLYLETLLHPTFFNSLSRLDVLVAIFITIHYYDGSVNEFHLISRQAPGQGTTEYPLLKWKTDYQALGR